MRSELVGQFSRFVNVSYSSGRFYFRHLLQTLRDGSVDKPGCMLNVAIFDPWQRSLFSPASVNTRKRVSASREVMSREVMLVQVHELQKIQKVHHWRIIGGTLIPIQRIFSYIKVPLCSNFRYPLFFYSFVHNTSSLDILPDFYL